MGLAEQMKPGEDPVCFCLLHFKEKPKSSAPSAHGKGDSRLTPQ